MNIEKRMNQVVREVKSGADTDPDWNTVESIKKAIKDFSLNDEEKRYLCRKFGILTEDLNV